MESIAAEAVNTGEQRDTQGRRRIPRARRLAVIAAFRASGMSMAAFARRERLNYSTLTGWLYKDSKGASSESLVKFAEVQVPGPKSCSRGTRVDFNVPQDKATLEVRLPDGTVLSGSDAPSLAALIKALRS